MEKRILWAIFGLLVVALIVTAFMFRYEPLTPFVGNSDGRPVVVWDRWSHRACFVFFGSAKVMCTADELRNPFDQFDPTTAHPVK